MALNAKTLESMIEAKLNQSGFQTIGEHAYIARLAAAIAEAVVEHITNNAEVPGYQGVYPVR